MGLQVIQAELACYAVPVTGFEHHWGISGARDDTPIRYFGREVFRSEVLEANRRQFLDKLFQQKPPPRVAAV